MEPQPREVELYQTEEGKATFSIWLEGLRDAKTRANILRRVARIRLGLLGDYKAVGDGVYELRIDIGPGYRIYFTQLGKTVILLLCAGDKGSQAADIRKAKEYWADYQERTS